MILHLFATRRTVPLKTIIDECGVSKRSALRYVQAFGNAGFPVHFDKEFDGYRLVNRVGGLAVLSAAETSLVYMGIEILESYLGPGYVESMKRVRSKLDAYMTRDAQNEFAATINSLSEKGPIDPLREHLILSLLKSVQKHRRSLKVEHITEKPGKRIFTEMKEASLVFDRVWKLRSSSRDSAEEIPLNSVVNIKVF